MDLKDINTLPTALQRPHAHDMDQHSNHADPGNTEIVNTDAENVTDTDDDFESLPSIPEFILRFEPIPTEEPYLRTSDNTWFNLRSVEMPPQLNEDHDKRWRRLMQVAIYEKAQKEKYNRIINVLHQRGYPQMQPYPVSQETIGEELRHAITMENHPQLDLQNNLHLSKTEFSSRYGNGEWYNVPLPWRDRWQTYRTLAVDLSWRSTVSISPTIPQPIVPPEHGPQYFNMAINDDSDMSGIEYESPDPDEDDDTNITATALHDPELLPDAGWVQLPTDLGSDLSHYHIDTDTYHNAFEDDGITPISRTFTATFSTANAFTRAIVDTARAQRDLRQSTEKDNYIAQPGGNALYWPPACTVWHCGQCRVQFKDMQSD